MTPALVARLVVGSSPCRSDLFCHHNASLGSAQGGERVTQRIGKAPAGVLDDLPGFGEDVAATLGDEETEFAEQAAEGVDGADAVGEPAGAQAVQGSDHLLGEVLDGDVSDLLVSEGLEQSVGVSAVGLVSDDVGADVLGRQQHDYVPELFDAARPEVSHAAGFHHHRRLGSLCEEGEEAIPGQAVARGHAARAIRDGDLEDFLCDVDGDESIVLHGMASFLACQQRLWHTMPIESSEESIPSMQLTKLRAAPVLQADVPPCALAGKMDGGTASQLIRSVRPTEVDPRVQRLLVG
jgi:hypothetical protein